MQPDFAFYYPGQRFQNVNWIKNLICFFDGIAMLIPEDMPNYRDRHAEETVLALEAHQLFRVIHPEEVVDRKATKALAKAFGKIIDSGRLHHLVRNSAFDTLAKAKLGTHSDHELADSIFQELRSRGLACDLRDDVYIAVDRAVLVLILTLLAHILKSKVEGITLSPATDQEDIVDVLCGILKPEFVPPVAGDVVSFDMNGIGVNLNRVPMDEVLDFRRENYCQHRDYIQSVRDFARELSCLSLGEREVKFEQRQEKLEDLSAGLRKIYCGSWKKPITFGIGLAGAAWASYTGDPIAAALAALATGAGLIADEPKEVDVYSYLISARQRFG